MLHPGPDLHLSGWACKQVTACLWDEAAPVPWFLGIQCLSISFKKIIHLPCIELQFWMKSLSRKTLIKLAADQSASFLKVTRGTDWVFGGLIPGNVFHMSFYMEVFSAMAGDLYFQNPTFDPSFRNPPSVTRLLKPHWFSESSLQFPGETTW